MLNGSTLQILKGTLCHLVVALSGRMTLSGLFIPLKPIFHCDAKPFTLGTGVGLDPQHHNFALPIPTCWYLKTRKFALPPTPNPNASQWNIGCIGSLGLLLISFALGPNIYRSTTVLRIDSGG